ncbi:hypothetical protein [Jiulongibacter sp. NS-SX5]|uniref:hypothetical protein n=1 Tax=Jiulongibacter sp. NS-SX5 TaxID=3463854 RepID=UPI004058F562
MFKRITQALPTFLILVALSFLTKNSAEAQGVGIGTTEPDNSAILDLSSSDKGLLLPRMSLENRTKIEKPAKGLIVYQTDFMSGLYIYNGQQWSSLGNTEAKLTADNSVWGTSGNTGLDASTAFIGTIDNTPLVFKVNDVNSGKIDPQRGNLFFGFKAAPISDSYNSIVLGALAMQKANTSGNNISIGFQSMFSNETGGHNVALGTGSIAANVHGANNVAIGSLSGYKSTGSGNVFLGFQSGYAEQGSNRLIINNDANRTPLIYGNFETGQLGINTSNPGNTLTIKSNLTNSSGLRFSSLNNTSPASVSNGKVLSVDASGDVILVADQVGETTEVTTYWNASGNNISNSNSGVTTIKNGLQLSSFQNMSDKFLGLDNAGNVVPVDAPSPVVEHGGGDSGLWYYDANDGKIKPSTEADVLISKRFDAHGLDLGWGGIKFKELNSNYPNPFPSNGLALSLDEYGHVILTANSDGGSGSGSSVWSHAGNIIRTPGDQKVVIGTGMNSYPDGYSLFVKKGILAERVRVAVANSAKWADYVFADNYNLMPLTKVEEFIEENDHLPNVPSAQEVAEGGIDIAEMSAKQMEKIEELTLYLIEANKRIEKLEKEIAQLKK